MAKTRTNLEDQTRTYLDEATTSDWTDAEVQREVNAGYLEVVTAVMETYENFYLITSQFNTVANQQEYGTVDAVPTDIFKINRVEINYDTTNTNNNPIRAYPVDINEVDGELANTAIGISVFRNAAYYLIGSSTGANGIKLGFIPIPTRNGTNAIKIWYIPEIAELSAAGSTINIPWPDRYGKLISLYAAATLLRKGQQEEEVARQYMGEFEVGMAKMKQQLEDRISDGSKAIIDTENQDTDFENYSTI